MIKTIDWYIIKKFLSTFLYMIIGFVFIVLIIDLGENVDKFLESDATIWQIAIEYYVPFSIQFANMLSPFIVFLTIIWITSSMAQKTELIAILSGGVSFNRMIRPFIITSVLLTIITVISSHFIVPLTNRIHYKFEEKHTRGRHDFGKHIFRELQTDTIYYFSGISDNDKVGYDFTREIWKDGELTEKIFALRATQNEDKTWKLKTGKIRTFLPNNTETIEEFKDKDFPLKMEFGDFGMPSEFVMNMNYFQLNDYIESERKKGSEKIAFLEVEKYNRTANAFSIIILTFIGVTMASRKMRGGIGIHLFLALIIGLCYVFFSRIAAVSAMKIGIPAFLAVWVPNVIFIFLGIVIYFKAPK